MSQKKRVTIKDVAQAAGVSTQTVSRVVNNRQGVLPDTERRVSQAIEALGYSPNIIARSLSQGRSHILGVVGFGLAYYGPTNLLTGIEQKSSELGFSTLLTIIETIDSEAIARIFDNLQARRVDGIIWAVPDNARSSQIVSKRTAAASVPILLLNTDPDESRPTVRMDSVEGGRLATSHLLAQGYRRVGIISGPQEWWEARQRIRGWRAALQAGGASADDCLIEEGDWSAASGDAALEALVQRCPDIDAVFVSNDQMALGALQAARRLGIQVPGQLGIVGFDDIPEAAYFFPSLTTVRQDLRALGGLAVQQMVAMIGGVGQHPAADLVLTPELVVRSSSRRTA